MPEMLLHNAPRAIGTGEGGRPACHSEDSRGGGSLFATSGSPAPKPRLLTRPQAMSRLRPHTRSADTAARWSCLQAAGRWCHVPRRGGAAGRRPPPRPRRPLRPTAAQMMRSGSCTRSCWHRWGPAARGRGGEGGCRWLQVFSVPHAGVATHDRLESARRRSRASASSWGRQLGQALVGPGRGGMAAGPPQARPWPLSPQGQHSWPSPQGRAPRPPPQPLQPPWHPQHLRLPQRWPSGRLWPRRSLSRSRRRRRLRTKSLTCCLLHPPHPPSPTTPTR